MTEEDWKLLERWGAMVFGPEWSESHLRKYRQWDMEGSSRAVDMVKAIQANWDYWSTRL